MKIIDKIKHHFYDLEYELPNIVVITGQKCTLKCKNCANFSPYHSKKLDFYDMDKTIDDLKNIVKRVKNVWHIQLQGGDFLLHKDALKMLEYVANEKKFLRCTLATNCIIIPNQKIVDVLKNKKFIVRISHYGTANETNESKLVKLLEENFVNVTFHKFANEDVTWSDCGGINTSKHTRKETRNNYKQCIFKVCTTLENGIISRCSRSTVAHYIQKFNPKRRDFINVRSPFFNIHDLKHFIKIKDSKSGIVTACYYCNGTSGNKIPAGEQMTIEEYKSIKMDKTPTVVRE